MSRQKLRVINTQLDYLISNLRGEVGEIITSWVLLRHMLTQQAKLTTRDVAKEMGNPELIFLSMLRAKLEDDIIARLSELAEYKIGRLTFHSAAIKLGKLNTEVQVFSAFIAREKFQQKRNQDISHNNCPRSGRLRGLSSSSIRSYSGVSHTRSG